MPAVKPLVTLLEYTTHPEMTVAKAAKLCYSDSTIEEIGEKLTEEDTAKFIRRLASFGHQSPVEHASFTFGIEGVSRALLAQITRHRIASFSVKSQRYVSCAEDFNYIVPNSIVALGETAVAEYTAQMKQIGQWYAYWQSRLGEGEKSNEDARFVLPNACETKMVVTMNARELLHFFELRCCNRAQWEIREVAWQMLRLVLTVAPNLFEKAGPKCVNGSCGEGKMSCKKAEEVRAYQQGLVNEAKEARK